MARLSSYLYFIHNGGLMCGLDIIMLMLYYVAVIISRKDIRDEYTRK